LKEIAEPYGRIRQAKQQANSRFGPAVARFPVEVAAGKTISFSGAIKTQDVDGFATLWWRADGERPPPLAFDNMSQGAPRGTTNWKHYAFELEIPEETRNINFGVLLSGSGKAWFDDLHIEVDGEPYVDEELFDLDFEGEKLHGFMLTAPGYQGTLDADVAATGKQSLRIEREPAKPGVDPAEAVGLATNVLARLEGSRETYTKETSKKDFAWARQNARVVLQCMQMRAGTVQRDKSMAVNVEWIAEMNPAAHLVLWAHNGHIGKTLPMMGGHLAHALGDAYVAVGFSTSEGTYTARSGMRGALATHDLAEPPKSSVEALLSKTGEPRLILDLRRAEAGDAGSGWIAEARPFRSIGAAAMERQFFPARLGQIFDLLVHIETTTAAVQMER
jgi:hypothetical protein